MILTMWTDESENSALDTKNDENEERDHHFNEETS